MSVRKTPFVDGEYYHVYNRGNSKQIIFRDKKDYARFLGLLFVCNSSENFKIDNLGSKKSFFDYSRGKQLVKIGAYVLMPNHFHLLLTNNTENGISKFMQKLTTAYVMYFNKKYQRTGSLFEGKFKAEHASTDRYLKYLFAYIHLNAAKLVEPKWREVGIKNKSSVLSFLNKYPYSSYFDYVGNNRAEVLIINKEVFAIYFTDKKDLEREIFEWLTYANI